MNRQPDGEMTVREQAAWWVAELEDATPAAEARLAEWLRRSQRHVEEFLLFSALWEKFDGVDAARRIDIDALVADAKASAPHKVVPFGAVASGLRNVRTLPRSGWRLAAAVAALGIGIGASWPWISQRLPGADTYATAIGEQRTVKLQDGSVLYLNTHTRVAVDYSGKARDIRLLEGEALFAVRRDPGRPFRVHSGEVVVQALGTQFNVYRTASGATVSVLEGAVQVTGNADAVTSGGGAIRTTDATQAQTARVSAGEQVEVSERGAIIKQAAADIDEALAWRTRRLVFRSTPLSEVAAEFNRYNALKIRVEGAAVGDKRLIGTFNADDPQALVQFLASEEALSTAHEDGALVIRPR
jgi:transmembrane sensor